MLALDRRTGIVVRNAQRWDVPELARVRMASWRHAYEGLIPELELRRMNAQDIARRMHRSLENQLATTMVVHRAGELPSGYALAGPQPDRSLGYRGEVFELYLRPEAQGQGAGRRLLSSVLWRLADRAQWPVLIWVLADNPARHFYEACGGHQVLASTVNVGGARLNRLGFAWERFLPVPDVG